MNWIQRFLQAITTHKAELDAHTRNLYEAMRADYYATPVPMATNTTEVKTLAADTLYAQPLPIPRAVTIDELSLQVITGAVGMKARLGIYEDDGSVYPGALVLDGGEVDVGSTGVKKVLISQALTEKLYWTVVISDGTPEMLRILRYWTPIGTKETKLGQLYSHLTRVQTYGVLPNPFPSGANLVSVTTVPYTMVVAHLASLD
ncbi:hypothetical protein ES703_120884 [subsurface metagenome]